MGEIPWISRFWSSGGGRQLTTGSEADEGSLLGASTPFYGWSLLSRLVPPLTSSTQDLCPSPHAGSSFRWTTFFKKIFIFQL